ncbi:response regulator [Paenibacillus sp. SC116]|uniref:response regulator n=1 Tax=Paenibacillus sp. SC116 TaxID=2968986 RepID=UPI00215AAA29|nr:response regulator [Paenibacillus sp. SC116]MCR8844989.1 response regulator [Paenibacillus sp. SC116]
MKVLIVDDEAHVRAAIRLLVDWQKHGIEQVDEAADGEQAIAYIQQHKPQIIMTDMMMPNVNGMKLMEWISEHSPNTKLIAISGHGDFNLVRHTLQHGGIDYLLKPIEPDSVNEAIGRAVEAWSKEEAERSKRNQQQIQMNEFKPVVSEKLWSSLIDDPSAQLSTIRRIQQSFELPINMEQIRLALVYVDADDEAFKQRFRQHRDLLYFSLVNIMSEYVNDSCKRGVVFRRWNSPGEIVIVLWQQTEALDILLQDINEALYRTLHRRLHFGCSGVRTFLGGMAQCYEEAKQALFERNLLIGDRYLHRIPATASTTASAESGTTTASNSHVGAATGAAGVSTPGAVAESLKSIRLSAYEENWKLAVLSGSAAQMAEALQPFIEAVRATGYITPKLLHASYREWETIRANIAHEAIGEAAAQLLRQYPSQLAQAHASPHIAEPFSLDAWQRLWLQELTLLADACYMQQGQEQHIIFDIAKYVEQHYHQDISLQEMAQRFFVSREYISRKFKQQFGINLSDYLAAIRTKKAKLLLMNPHLRISQVAAMVGIPDEKYFSKVFKKQVGVSPNEYRKSQQL